MEARKGTPWQYASRRGTRERNRQTMVDMIKEFPSCAIESSDDVWVAYSDRYERPMYNDGAARAAGISAKGDRTGLRVYPIFDSFAPASKPHVMLLRSALLLVLPLLVKSSLDEQIALPADSGIMPETEQPTVLHSQPTLYDLLTIEPAASIFFSYARETEMSRLFEDINAKSTVLVPTNKAIMALTRKPHQDPEPVHDDIEISEQEFDARSKGNVERWVSMHIIPKSPIELSSQTYQTLNDDKKVSFSEAKGSPDAPEWTRVLLDGDVQITKMKEASNGVLYVIDGTVKDD
ncbi:hypothetical protein EVG20_g1205 [Dentipellis fragilis]|uniref:FAS1 domain-containing protein n=1 Tax=Dentipellis fragilis TaxID=205917 RepID=A0A4Y9ZBG1_9AGAM|nr:hypothetical protein EVG20_g1205 [Dentipellis fragilis]